MVLLTTWILACAVLALPIMAAHLWLVRRGTTDERILLVGPLVAAGGLAYVVFFAFFLHRVVGFTVAFAAVAVSAVQVFGGGWRRFPVLAASPLVFPALLGFGIGLAYLSLLFVPSTGVGPEWQSATRFIYPLPVDPNLPMMIGDRLYDGQPVKPFLPDSGWLSSDRPPLQSGFYLLARPWLALAGLPAGWIYQCVGTLAQLFWVPAVWLLGRRLALDRRRSTVLVLVVAATGFALLNSTYVWPKLLSGAFGLMAGVLLLDRSAPRTAAIAALAGAAAALGWLAHGAVAFSLLTLAPVLLLPRLFPGWKQVLLAAAAFAVLALPWTAYQQCYDPPGNRLLKWHLAGVVDIDARPTVKAIRDEYAAQPSAVIIDHKLANYGMLRQRNFSAIFNIFTTAAYDRKVDEFFYVLRSLGVLNLAWVLAPLAWLVRRRWPERAGLLGAVFGWTLLTLLVWPALFFTPGATLVHQSSYTMMLALFGLSLVFLDSLPRWLGWPVLGWQVLYFAVTWIPYYKSPPVERTMVGLGLTGVALIAVVAGHAFTGQLPSLSALRARLAAWSQRTAGDGKRFPVRGAVASALVAVLILFLRRPECFLHPQFWAEDASVFFLQSEFMGTFALTLPYGGYHHLLLRLIAAAASPLDPAWIPAAYLWASIAVLVAVILALFSRRLDLPNRPALALAIVLMPQTGEVLGNLTNAQWVAAIGLVLLLLARDPDGVGTWIVDLFAALVVGMTGVFSLVLSPLFLLRAVRRKTLASWMLFAAVLAAAVVQGWALTHSELPEGTGPFVGSEFAQVLALRPWGTLLVAAPYVTSLPTVALLVAAALATVFLVGGADTTAKRTLWGVAALVLGATLFKFRHEYSGLLEPEYGDRYFFVPRLMVVWLLLLAWRGPQAWLARPVLVLAAIASLLTFRLIPLADHDWPAWAERIRRGERVVVPINPGNSTFTYPGRNPPPP